MPIVSQTKAVGQIRRRVIAGVSVYEQIIPTAGRPDYYQPITAPAVESVWKSICRLTAQPGVN